jgi:hypothetical protein
MEEFPDDADFAYGTVRQEVSQLAPPLQPEPKHKQLTVAENAQLDRLIFLQQKKIKLGLRLEALENLFDTDEFSKDHIIKGVFAWDETSAWIAPPGGMKSALLASAAMHAALALPWFGKKNSGQRVGVVYFALERADLVRRRLIAHRTKLGLPAREPIPIVIVPDMLDLMNPATVPLVVEAVKRAEEYFGLLPGDKVEQAGLLIFDTFAKLIAAGGGDENSAKDQGRVFANLQRIKDELGGPHVALIGHTGKDISRGARGSNALYGDVDVMVEITGDTIKTATVTKANDAPEGPLFSFKSEVHEFGIDEDGEPITVNVVSQEEVSIATKGKASWSPGLRLVRDAVAAAVLEAAIDHLVSGEGPMVKAAPVQAARAIHNRRYVSTGDGDRTEAERKAWQRNFKAARSANLIGGELDAGQELIWLVT